MEETKNFILNSYKPLCKEDSRWERLNKPPFVDYNTSYPEPDFELEYPSISSICRAHLSIVNVDFEFGKVKEGDLIVYVTTKWKYFDSIRHRRVVAILEVFKKFDSHEMAYEWYRENSYQIPRNCITNRLGDDAPHERAGAYPSFLACKAVFLNLNHPPGMIESDEERIFETGMPNTRIPCDISSKEFENILEFVNR